MNRHVQLHRNALLLLTLAGLFALTGISRSTPPLPPPYHDFLVAGEVIRTGGGSLEGISVGVFDTGHPITVLISGTRRSEFERAIGLTDENGSYAIRVRTRDFFIDSVTAGVVLVDTTLAPIDTVFSLATFALSDIQRQEVIARGTFPDDGFCDSEKESEWVDGYIYEDTPEQVITVP